MNIKFNVVRNPYNYNLRNTDTSYSKTTHIQTNYNFNNKKKEISFGESLEDYYYSEWQTAKGLVATYQNKLEELYRIKDSASSQEETRETELEIMRIIKLKKAAAKEASDWHEKYIEEWHRVDEEWGEE